MKAKFTLLAIGVLRRYGWLMLLVVSAGCSSKGTVSGKVTYQGKPVPAGTVIFVPLAGGGGFTANIRDGAYTVEGLPLGPVKISVSTPVNAAHMKELVSKMRPPPEMMQKVAPGKSAEGSAPPSQDTQAVSIPARFQDPEKSGLTYTVKSGSQVYDIDIPPK
jgi:hypothetical protein